VSNSDIDYIESELRKTKVAGAKVSPWPPDSTHPEWLNAWTRLESLRTVAPPPTDPTLLFEDTFDGAAGAKPDPAKWYVIDGYSINGLKSAAANVFLDGQGHLVVRTARSGSTYSAGFVGTFNYTGWPPSGIKASFPVPFRVEASMLMPPTPGAWAALWPMSVDRSTNIYELDIAEERLTLPTSAGSHQHTWAAGKDTNPADASLAVSDMTKNWHTYRGDVYADRVETFVDGVQVGTFYGVSGVFGLLLNNGIGPVGSWGAAGGQPAASDPGPWDMLIDYVRVWLA
jgi:hypothetical protein